MKQFIKKIAVSMLILAMCITILPTDAQAAKVKLNKKSATIYAGETVTLKLSGAKNVKWSSSNKKCASVTAKGVVKGLKAGNCKITAKSAGKSYTCNVKVKAVEKFGFNKYSFHFNGAGNSIWYNDGDISAELKDTTIKVDGKKVDNSNIWANDITEIACSKVEDGTHTLTISKKGYETFKVSLVYEAPTFSNNLVDEGDIGINEEEKSIYMCINPAVIGKELNITVNGESVFSKVATEDDTNGDGYVFLWYELKDFGDYNITVSCEGFDTYTTVVNYK